MSAAGDGLFRPWRSERTYALVLVVLTVSFFLICRANRTILESQIALGIDPRQCAIAFSAALAASLLILVLLALRARRFFLTTGELRISGETMALASEGLSSTRALASLQRISTSYSGADVRLRFPDETVGLDGQWLPDGWKRTWRGWRDPTGRHVLLRRETHPLAIALGTHRPDIKPRLAGMWSEAVLALLMVLVPTIGRLPLVLATRSLAKAVPVNDVAQPLFQNGQYAKSCEAYRRAVPALRHDLYGSQVAAEFLTYCGDHGLATKAYLAFDGSPLWPAPPDPYYLAQVWVARERYERAEFLLAGQPSYLLYVALSGQGRQAEAEAVLEQLRDKDGLATVLLLRRRGDPESARQAAALCSGFLLHKPTRPSWLARIFESCLLAGGVSRLTEDPRFESAVRELPGLRAELVRFANREVPEAVAPLKAYLETVDAKPRTDGPP